MMQYYKPEGDYFVGDCMPFFHDGTFRLYYLLDEKHHQALGGLGGHQWAQASSRNLVHWDHHPLAIAITGEHEGSICTGSVFFHEGVYYGFYATRLGDWTQHLSLAVSCDGIRFEKTEPNLFASPPAGYDPLHYRDPVVFQVGDDGLFHMLVTACLKDPAVPGCGGCLAHLVSTDLRNWENREPFIIPGFPDVPECPDYFAWNGWYYLLFSNGGIARYRMSKTPLGPWTRPLVDTLDGPVSRVMKTAAFTGGRRLGAAWVGMRQDNRDNGGHQFGGNAVFRELVQRDDGTLAARFPAEMIPEGAALSHVNLTALGTGVRIDGRHIRMRPRRQGLAAALASGIPRNAHLALRVVPGDGAGEFGVRLRAGAAFDTGYDLRVFPGERSVVFNGLRLFAVDGMDQPFTVEVVLKDRLIDICIDKRRTIIDQCPAQQGDRVYFYGQDRNVDFEVLETSALF